ncbi:hypothetical protein ACWKWU_20910 [Chitinophaga lutea]
MYSIPEHIKLAFFQAKIGVISKNDFEAWLYQCKELEKHLESDAYFELISFSYKSAHRIDFVKLIDKYIDPAEYEYYSLMRKLDEVLNKDMHPDILHDLYYLYCNGYGFMDTLGLVYGLNYAETCINLGKNSPEAKVLIDTYFPEFQFEVARVKTLLESGRVIIKGKDEANNYDYVEIESES